MFGLMIVVECMCIVYVDIVLWMIFDVNCVDV